MSITRQCSLLGIHKSSYYYKSKGESELNLKLMKLIDKQYQKRPFWGVPSMSIWLKKDMDYNINSKRIERLYRLMDLRAIVPGPHTSKGNKQHKTYPYLLESLKIERINQVWATDITYIPVEGGYFYLMAVIDLKSRFVVGWSISNTMDAEWCQETMQECVEQYGVPEIVNTDQGSQFTSEVFTSYLHSKQIRISMDGKGRAIDNIFIERLWRTVKYEDIYLKAYATGNELFVGLLEYFDFYNHQRRHSSLEHKRPRELYFEESNLAFISKAKVSSIPEPVKGINGLPQAQHKPPLTEPDIEIYEALEMRNQKIKLSLTTLRS
ncbi:IS3 family transposase [Aureibacter tunicatorum]|uniref:IS3 family transposase n=1 Tax=Aureibacter tunicatorum TaxID=866807 RepID=UPI0030CA1B33